MKRRYAIKRGNDGLNGERGLLCAVLVQALNDYHAGTPAERQDARRYFASDVYRTHLTLLDLAPDLMPDLTQLAVGK